MSGPGYAILLEQAKVNIEQEGRKIRPEILKQPSRVNAALLVPQCARVDLSLIHI